MRSQKVCTKTTQTFQKYDKIKVRNRTELKIHAVHMSVMNNISMPISDFISHFNVYKFLLT